MQRGIVIEIQAEHLVILTTDGLFEKIPKQDKQVEIGEEVTYSIPQTPPKRNWKVYISGAVAAVLALFFLFPLFLDEKAHAHSHVYIEIEPGIEMGLNEKLEVIQVRPLNPKANALIQKLAWNKKPVKKVVVDYLRQAKTSGYLKKKDKIVLSAINEKGSSTPTLQSIETVIEQDPSIGKKALNIEVFTFAMPKEIKTKADKTGLTPGKYGVWLLSKKEGKEIPVKQLVESPISDIADNIERLKHPPTESEWKEIAEEESPKDSKGLTDPTKKNSNTIPSKNSNNKSMDNPFENRNDPSMKDSYKDMQIPSKKIEDKKQDENKLKMKETGGEENSTAGSTGDSSSKTNHATP